MDAINLKAINKKYGNRYLRNYKQLVYLNIISTILL